jgi:N-acetylmuramoyl-L-alanine amidase
VVEVSEDFSFRSDRVPDPDRLFFDLTNTRPRLGTRGVHTVTINDDRLKQIRVAQTTPGKTRVVFDLAADVEVTASHLPSPHRLIVELKPKVTRPAAEVTISSTGAQKISAPASVIVEPPLPQVTAADLEIPQRNTAARIAEPARQTPPALTTTASKLPANPPALATNPALEPAPNPATTKPEVALNPPPSPPPTKVAVAKRTVVLPTPKPAKLPKTSDSSLTRVLGLKIGRIVIDPGHGGHDTGTIGENGLTEKDLVLDVAKRLAELVETRLNSEVVLTRTDDTFIPLEARTAMANEAKADLFLSIHANSSPVRTSSGVETFYLNFTTDRTALEVAARENASSQMSVHELSDVVQKIALRDKVDESREFALRVQRALYTASVKANSKTRDRGVKKAPFVVLIGARMSAIRGTKPT